MAANTPSTKLHLESIDRIGSIPLVETSLKHAELIYGKVKTSNRLFNWYFETAEYTITSAYESVMPAVKLFESPLKRLDNVVCKSLDILEQHIPLVYLPPEMTIILGLKMYWNTKEYMSDHLVRPVLKRADSVKQIGNAVLESPITTFAAERLDGALTVGDKFVDKYLIPIDGEADQTDAPNEDNNAETPNEKGAIKAIHHGQRFSRKLKRRLTQRTLAEARALKKQSKEAIHVLIYAAELIATDPKLALQKAKELWSYLSQDEPENQARPTTLEQLIVLLTRESARRLVHMVNFGANVAANIPKTVAHTSTEVVHHIIYINNRFISLTKLDKVRDLSKEEAQTIIKRMVAFYGDLQCLTNTYLERLATFLSGRIEAEKVSGHRSTVGSTSSGTSARRRLDVQENNTPSSHNNINGVY
ncbi:lipid storage droplets surface-binding protein 1 isoform X3 [Musca domestica]|uniref:Lipid storage droplets surface-binding protein 1 isoform X3 n=1 Tax=Musca domestica TaxID=7370 RepID=A0A9J7DL91_MUSDO|nr:lipid storage droplets surface-binding protein 1 isoform X3 [Musca domestica]